MLAVTFTTADGPNRNQGHSTKTMRIPSGIVRAVESLKAIAAGTGTQRDIAEILIAINEGGRAERVYGGVVGHDEICAARRAANTQGCRSFDAQEIADLQAFISRADAVLEGRV